MPPPPTPSPSTSNIMPPPSGSNTIPPPPTPFGSNTMPSHATPGSNTGAGFKTMPSQAAYALTRTNKGKCPLIPKKIRKPAKSSAFSSIGGSRVMQPTKVVLGVVQAKEVEVQAKEVE
ncbi:hypothetical protein Tco_0239582, partial [Tanacetum coccineum]